MISEQLLDILVCPKCKGEISMVEGGRGLVCEACQLKYPVRDDIPIMLVPEATDLKGGGKSGSKASDISVPATTFRVMSGPNKGMVFHLERGTCKVIGRALSDPHKTTMFNVDLTLALDESTKNVVQQYISKQFRKPEKGAEGGGLGSFKRTSDVILDDISISRLHAMIFYDEAGVGVLDLVSKNGTYVNGEEVESRLLRKSDAIEVGETRIIFER